MTCCKFKPTHSGKLVSILPEVKWFKAVIPVSLSIKMKAKKYPNTMNSVYKQSVNPPVKSVSKSVSQPASQSASQLCLLACEKNSIIEFIAYVC